MSNQVRRLGRTTATEIRPHKRAWHSGFERRLVGSPSELRYGVRSRNPAGSTRGPNRRHSKFQLPVRTHFDGDVDLACVRPYRVRTKDVQLKTLASRAGHGRAKANYIPSMMAFSVTLGRIAAAHLASSGK